MRPPGAHAVAQTTHLSAINAVDTQAWHRVLTHCACCCCSECTFDADRPSKSCDPLLVAVVLQEHLSMNARRLLSAALCGAAAFSGGAKAVRLLCSLGSVLTHACWHRKRWRGDKIHDSSVRLVPFLLHLMWSLASCALQLRILGANGWLLCTDQSTIERTHILRR